jgi:hypothetical protein
LKRISVACIGVIVFLLIVSCGGNNKTTTTVAPPSYSGLQFVSPTTNPSIDAGQSVSITASEPATWSLEALSGKPVGCFGTTTTPCITSISTASATVTYTAPASINTSTGSAQVSIVATSASGIPQTAILPVIINSPVSVNSLTHLTTNTDCSYSPALSNGDGAVGSTYTQGQNVASLEVLGGTAPYGWKIVSGALPIGLTLGTESGTLNCSTSCAFLYGTPVSAGCSQVQLSVTDATGSLSTSRVYYVVITPPALKVQAPDYVDMYAGVAYPPTAFAVSGGIPPYSWSASSPLPTNVALTVPPQNTATAYISGATTVAQPSPPALLVTDSQTPYPAVGTITLNQAVNVPQPSCMPFQFIGGGFAGTYNSSMMGSYAFLLHGFDADGAVSIAGSFTADGAGNVQSGAEDIMRSTTAGSETNVAVSGSYSVFQQQSDSITFREVGCVTLTDATTGTSNTFAFTLGGCPTSVNLTVGECETSSGTPAAFTTGRMIEFDNSGTRASGILRLQDSSAFSSGLSGPYSFGLSGWDSVGARYAAAGSFNAGSGTLTSAAADINDAGTLQSALTGGSGSYAVNETTGSQNGRGSATLTIGSASYNLALYMVSANEVMLTATGTASAANPIVNGEGITAAGPFSAGSLQNTHMFHIAGTAPDVGPDVSIGTLSFDGVSSLSGTQYENQAGTLGTTSLSGTYSVNSTTGRFAFLASSTNNESLGNHPLVGYAVPSPATRTRQDCTVLANCVTGFLVSTDQSAQAGLLEFQTPAPALAPPPPFSILYIAGYYFFGTDEALDSATPLINGTANANPTGSLYSAVQSVSYASNSFYCQQEPGCTQLQPNESISSPGTYSVNTNGTGAIGGQTVTVTNGNVIFYLDESPLNAHPSVMVFEQ